MNDVKHGGLIAGGILALLGGVLSVAMVTSSPSALEQRVDRDLARLRDEGPETRYQDATREADELKRVVEDDAFGRLDPVKQEAVRGRLRELTAYLDFEKSLGKVPALGDAQNEEQLRRVEARLQEVAPPEARRAEWEPTPAGKRYRALQEESQTLRGAVTETAKAYRKLAADGRQVLKERNAPQLPRRAKMVLDRAQTLPAPKRDVDRPVPGAGTLTYGRVLAFADVAEAYQEWETVREQLKPLAELE